MVLGEKIGEQKGKFMGMSVKSVGPEGVRMEMTFVTEIKSLGRFPSGRNIGTMDVVEGSGGFFSGTGQGIFTTLLKLRAAHWTFKRIILFGQYTH